jgi:hypothetical protein
MPSAFTDRSGALVEDYYLGKRESVDRAEGEAIAAIRNPKHFAALVQSIPGYDTRVSVKP